MQNWKGAPMAKKKQAYRADYFAAADSKDHFGTIYEGMCLNPKYRQLSIGARHFYMLCRVQARSEQGNRCLYTYANSEGKTFPDNCFVFPSSHQKRFGIDRRNGSRYFAELEKSGFIRCVEQNEYRHRPNVYAFDSKWKDSS